MNRNRINTLNRREEAVSPVIATILMVAITVVLAATLYMMVGEVGGESVRSLTARASIEKYDWYESDGVYVLDLEFKINSMSSPSSADVEDIDIRVLYEDENGNMREHLIEEAREEGNWRGLVNGKVRGGSTFTIRGLELDHYTDEDETLKRAELRIDGYDGVESAKF